MTNPIVNPKLGESPYTGLAISDWPKRTADLVKAHPLDMQSLSNIVLKSWEAIFDSKIARFQIGKEILPKPQVMGFFLQELITLELMQQHPGVWRGEKIASDKDIVYIPNDNYSVEVKSSSSGNRIYGNRSFAQKGNTSKKKKMGYYLAINYEKFRSPDKAGNMRPPKIKLIRFGWVDGDDWVGQVAQTGQQASLSIDVERNKFVILYSLK